jgi:hypothetical protein
MEAFNRNLSAEFGSCGIRAVCICSTGFPETHTIEVIFGLLLPNRLHSSVERYEQARLRPASFDSTFGGWF